ncbi:helix-turn-helix domain-containing protein [Acetobacter tropicalis]|uniref:hypothetical protein n=1 Tax=Acetobacter tropicalis TaxID=104102 RepID=UPI000777D88A|nr:hypothetical protein [Acetobacter tropicalis]
MTVDKLRTSSPRLKIFDSVHAASDTHVQENLLNMAWQDGSCRAFVHALGVIAKARGGDSASNDDVQSTEELLSVLSNKKNLRLTDLLRILAVMNVQVTFKLSSLSD